MNVTRIEEYRAQDIVSTLRDLLARAEVGRLRAMAFSIKDGPKRHRFGFIGEYNTDPFEALACVTRMEYKVNQLISARDDEPDTTTMPL